MIVKNEEKIIKRCLESVIPFIDFFVIMDTGSNDNTMGLIKKTFSTSNSHRGVGGGKIRGILYKGEFKNFSHARNMSLAVAYEKSNCDFILFMDADHLLQFPRGNSEKIKQSLDPAIGSYYITQYDGKLEYKNTRLIRNDRDYYYKGYTHEVLFSFHKDKRATLDRGNIFIDDRGDGGSKDNKSDRDERLLLQEIMEIEEVEGRELSRPSTYSRPYFYLANTYFGKKKLDLAEKYYRKRISFGGWKEELWFCYYRLGAIKILQKNPPEAIYMLMSAIETNHKRLEAYFHLLLIFRDLRMDINFDIYLSRAKDIYFCEFSTQDFLFHEKEICEDKFREEFL